jgi:hypothetical protein
MENYTWLKKPFDIQSSYTEIQEVVNQHGPPLVFLDKLPTYNAAFFGGLLNLAVNKGSEYSLPPKEEECDKEHVTGYANGDMETIMLVIGLSCLSWLSFNIKRKTEEGHCKNPKHDLKNGHPYCPKGKAFHGKLYHDLLKILQEVTDSIKNNTPQNAV